MNPFKRTSVASLANTSDHSSEGGGSNRNSLEAPIELSEQLTPRRPLRSDEQRRLSRPNSFQLMPPIMNSTSNSSLVSNTSSTAENSDFELGDEMPTPPLPEKTAYSDYSNVEITPSPSHHRANSGNRKSKPVPPLPTELNGTPPPVPKKYTSKQASLT